MTALDPDRQTLVIGLGETGVATACHLESRGQRVRVIDSRAEPPGLDALRRRCPNVPVELETLAPRWLEGISQVVLSPGLALDIPIAVEARRREIPVVSDIELFARVANATDSTVLAVTGSNGKSTVVTMLESMLQASGMRAVAGGNLGPPALDLLGGEAFQAYLLEVSSFQLETTESLRPQAAAVLNVSADHLDRHESLERYAALKERLLSASDTAVVNLDDPVVRQMGANHPKPVGYSVREPLERGYSVSINNGQRWLARNGEPLVPVSSLRVRGAHNESNALAALALAEILAGDSESLLTALQRFPGLPHRCQWVAEQEGVDFINDSKGTNVGATVAALDGLPGPLVLIAGGLGKGADFAPLAGAAADKLKGAVLIGESADALQAVLADVCPTESAESINEAVARARRMVVAGDTVLLSPACASQDMFTDYQARGDAFIAAIRESAS